MKRSLDPSLLVVLALLVVCSACGQEPTQDPGGSDEGDPTDVAECTVSTRESLGCGIPSEVAVPAGGDPAAVQRAFDDFAWQMFVGLNWPTSGGEVDPAAMIGSADGHPRVWELFTDPVDIFTADAACEADPDLKTHFESSKLTRMRNLIDDPNFDLQAASNWPLVDQEGNFAVNEIRVGPTLCEHIVGEGLYKTEVVEALTWIELPVGSIELKAAWRVFPGDTPAEIKARYHTRQAEILVPAKKIKNGCGGAETCKLDAELGLVGLHIAQKTPNNPAWVWATFEQVDNLQASVGVPPTFNDGDASVGDPTNNRSPVDRSTDQRPPVPPGYLWQLDPDTGTAGKYTHTEVQRTANEIALPEVNGVWQQALREAAPEGPWPNYQLIVSQWLGSAQIDADTGALLAGEIHPTNGEGIGIGRNSTLETYLLGDQALARQVPAIQQYGTEVMDGHWHGPALVPSGPGTLDQLILATIEASKVDPLKGSDVTMTWSSCLLCHQLGVHTIQNGSMSGDEPRIVVPTDFSMLWQAFPLVGSTTKGDG